MGLTDASLGYWREVAASTVSKLVSVHFSGGARAYGQAGSGSPMRVPAEVEADPLDDATLVARSRDGDMRSYEHEAVGPRSRPDHVAEVSEQMSALGQALTGLTPDQRACWLLREVHGRSYDEIAQTIGTTTQAVRGRIARARAQLAEVMALWR